MTVDGMVGGTSGSGRLCKSAAITDGRFAGHLTAAWPENEAITFSLDEFKAGKFALTSNGSIDPQSGAFDLATSASTKSPQTGYDLADRLLQGDVGLAGRITGDGEGGISLADWRLISDAVEANLAGKLDAATVDLALEATVEDLCPHR